MKIHIETIETYLLELQKQICASFEREDGTQVFIRDAWQREHQGHGLTCALSDGAVIEKCGVNFSKVAGERLPVQATARHPELADAPFTALGLSLIVHPRNPYAPTVHLNLRFFTAQKTGARAVWWFGGGFDLTPYYGFVEDCVHWHQTAQAACAPFGADVYPRYKRWADEYFYLPHRQEPRGIGGIFFDDLNTWEFERCLEFTRSVGDHFLPAYQPILARRKAHGYGEREREFQLYRRGRYAEFNLVYDRGTQFGLRFGGRIESILISLPPQVSWRYNWQPEAGSEEARLYEEFLVPRDWVEG